MANKSKGYSLFSLAATTPVGLGILARAAHATPGITGMKKRRNVTSRKFRSSQLYVRPAYATNFVGAAGVAKKRKKSPANKAQKRAARATSGRR